MFAKVGLRKAPPPPQFLFGGGVPDGGHCSDGHCGDDGVDFDQTVSENSSLRGFEQANGRDSKNQKHPAPIHFFQRHGFW